MNELVTALGVAVVVFAATNVDDILLLAAFFADPGLSPRQVVAGQFLGMSVLVAASAVCALFAVVIPAGWIGLLGVVPLALGVYGLLRRTGGDGDAAPNAQGASGGSSRWLGVAGVTIANGGDNLGVYIPMFSSGRRLLGLYVAVFAVLTAVCCLLGHYLVNNPVVGKQLARYGQAALPFVLIALGSWILADARALIWPEAR
jgi:cadmium resistance protein CadD (predicted permease)